MAWDKRELEIIEAEILQETDKAILVWYDLREIWLPKSQIEYCGDVGDTVDIEVPAWLAEEKGL